MIRAIFGRCIRGRGAPGNPRQAIEKTREPEAAGDAPGQNDGFERFEKNGEENGDSEDDENYVHSLSSFADHGDIGFEDARDRAIGLRGGSGAGEGFGGGTGDPAR